MSSVLTTTPTKILRQHVANPEQYRDGIDRGAVAEVVQTLHRTNDIGLVRDAMINRYAKTIHKSTDQNTGATTSKLVTGRVEAMDQGMMQAILAGQFEITRQYTMDMIVRKSATLFSEDGLRYEYDTDGVDETMLELRTDSGANISVQRWDSLACGTGSSLLYLSVMNGVLQESEVPLCSFWYAFGNTVTEADGNVRPPNTDNIDEASVVVMELGAAGNDGKGRFAAWYGPSSLYDMGRHCVYEANAWYEIPDVGDHGSGVLDYTLSGNMETGAGMDEIANPLTAWADQSSDWGVPVYPFVILYYDPLSSGLLPSSTSLYDACQEFDLAGSLILGAAGKGARGLQAVEQADGGASTTLPDNVSEGYVVIGRGLQLSQKGWSPAHAKAASEVLDHAIRNAATAFNVPSFLVSPNQSGNVPSGVALDIMMDPMRRFRQSRINLNRRSVARRFDVERALVNATLGTETIPTGAREVWVAGNIEIPRDPQLVVETWTARIAAGEADIADMAEDMRGLESREAAWNYIETAKQEQAANGVQTPAQEPEQAPVGIAGRIRARRGNNG